MKKYGSFQTLPSKMKSKSSLSFSSSSKSSTPVSNVSSSSGISSSSSVPSCRSSKLRPQLNSKGKILLLLVQLFKAQTTTDQRGGLFRVFKKMQNKTDLTNGPLRVLLENTDLVFGASTVFLESTYLIDCKSLF